MSGKITKRYVIVNSTLIKVETEIPIWYNSQSLSNIRGSYRIRIQIHIRSDELFVEWIYLRVQTFVWYATFNLKMVILL